MELFHSTVVRSAINQSPKTLMFKKMSTKKKKQKSAANWDYLPEHLLEDVLDRFVEVSDYVRFSAVCKRWLSAAQFHHNQWRLKSSSSPQKQTPMLLVHNYGPIKNLSLHSVVVGKLHQLLINKAADLHVPDYICKDTMIRCCGSSHGWLIFIHDDTFALILYNPFTKSTINIPPIFDVPEEESDSFTVILDWFKKVFLSEDPSLFPDTYQVLVLYNLDFIWLFRSGSDSWVRVRRPQIPDTDIRLTSRHYDTHAIYYRGKFYIEGYRSLITVETTNDAVFRYPGFQQLPNTAGIIGVQHLAESCNGCLLYIESCDDDMFNVYEVNLNDEDGPMCSLVPTLGGETLFLGSNYSLSLLGSFQPDCIHAYTCVYDVLHRNTKRLSPSSIGVVSAIWIVPQANLNTSYSLVAD